MNNNFNFNVNDKTGEFSSSDIDSNKGISVVAYIPVLFFVPLIVSSDSPYAKFHANQGLILTLASLILSVAVSIISFIFGIVPFIGDFISNVVSIAASVVIFAYMIIGIINAVGGKAKKLPFIGSIFTLIK